GLSTQITKRILPWISGLKVF
ncbi:NAD(P)-binding Rossmann-like domain protein, partial [Chlamydia psittaci 08-2626_L3]